MIYTVRFPLLKDSTSECVIEDQDGNIAGYLQRYHATKIQKFVNLLLTNMFNNVRAYDRDKKVVVDIAEINNLKTLVREKREVNAYGQKFEFATRTIVKTHPQYLYKRNDQEIWVKKNLGDRTVRFVIDDRVTAMAVPEGIAPPKSSHVTFHIDGPDLDICEAASLYFVFSLKN